MPKATKVTVVPPEVVYAERLIKRLCNFYEIPAIELKLHPQYPIRLQSYVARYHHAWNGRAPFIELAFPYKIEQTTAHEVQHHIDALMGYKEHHSLHSPGFYRRLAITMAEARAARDCDTN